MDNTASILRSSYGLASDFADRVAELLAYLDSSGLRPVITSGFRDPSHQKELRARWDRGDRVGLRARPALDSLHSQTTWLGTPASKAIDITTTDDVRAAAIARALGIGVGLDFKEPDRGHYFAKEA